MVEDRPLTKFEFRIAVPAGHHAKRIGCTRAYPLNTHVGCEIDERYCEIAARRLRDEASGTIGTFAFDDQLPMAVASAHT